MRAGVGEELFAMHARFGELLGRLVELSPHDVHEILAEQQSTRRRFGEIALSWGLCRPEHVWRAWTEQAVQDGQIVDLDAVGVDAQAVSELPPDLAHRFGIIPIRSFAERLIIATPGALSEEAQREVQQHVNKTVGYVHAHAAQIQELINAYYTPVA